MPRSYVVSGSSEVSREDVRRNVKMGKVAPGNTCSTREEVYLHLQKMYNTCEIWQTNDKLRRKNFLDL
jgi:hypothetical protein